MSEHGKWCTAVRLGSCKHGEMDGAGRLPGGHGRAAGTGAARGRHHEMRGGLTRYLSKQPGEPTGRR